MIGVHPFWVSVTFALDPAPTPDSFTELGRALMAALVDHPDLGAPIVSFAGNGRVVIGVVVDAGDDAEALADGVTILVEVVATVRRDDPTGDASDSAVDADVAPLGGA